MAFVRFANVMVIIQCNKVITAVYLLLANVWYVDIKLEWGVQSRAFVVEYGTLVPELLIIIMIVGCQHWQIQDQVMKWWNASGFDPAKGVESLRP